VAKATNPWNARSLRQRLTRNFPVHTKTMSNTIPDDVFALYSRFGLDEQEYRTFAPLQESMSETKVEMPGVQASESSFASHQKNPVPEQPEPVIDEISSTQCPAPSGSRHPITVAAELSEIDLSSLHNLRRYLALSSKVQKVKHEPAALSAIKIYGAAGGVGVTTLAAALAKLIAKANQRCAVVESAGHSSLSVFFGSQRLDEQKKFFGVQSIFEPRTLVLNTRNFNGAFKSGGDLADWIAAETGGDLDHVIFDRPAESYESFASALNICVAIPDVSSLIGARKLKIDLENIEDTPRTLCVLNRFDAGNRLHQEIRAWYQQNFAEVVTVSESPLVSEALAEGSTVIDWAPETVISSDFVALFNAVRLLATDADRVPVAICR
jgi:cellulose biosynthesis protein BcsQ